MQTDLRLGDCLNVLSQLNSDSVDTIITDPPYGLEFMGKGWDKILPNPAIWQQVIRVLKPGAIALVFGGTRTFHRLACALEDAGFEIRDCLSWNYGSGFPKSWNFKEGKFKGYGTALKPAWEPIILAMKPCSGTFADNAEKYGVAGLNIDGGRIEGKWERSTHTIADIRCGNYKTYKGVIDIGRGQECHPSGRWPANLLLDEQAAAMLDQMAPQTGGGHWSGKVPEGGGLYKLGLKPMEDKGSDNTYSGASRFFYCAKASRSERNAGLEGLEAKTNLHSTYGIHSDEGLKWNGRNPENRTRKMQNNHPTVKPIKLMEYLCTLTRTPTGGIVLDPFMGSGTTGIACVNTGRDFIGIEKEQDYFEIAKRRIEHAKKEKLF